MPTYHHNTALNSDDGAYQFAVRADLYRHQIAIDCTATSGTVAVAARPVGSDEYKAVANDLDLSDDNAQVGLFEGFFTHIRVTPSLAASTEYAVAYIAGAI